jgi:hypothetical protein
MFESWARRMTALAQLAFGSILQPPTVVCALE